MATQIQWASVTRLLCTLVLSSALTACSTGLLQPSVVPEPAPDMFTPLDRPAEQYRAQAEVATEDDAFAWEVLAIRALLQQGDTAEAQERLTALRASATLTQQPVISLLDATILMSEQQSAQSLQRLQGIDPQVLPPSSRAYLWLLQANLYEQQQQPLEAARALIARHPLLAGPAQNNNRERIYHLLSQVSTASLRRAQSEQNPAEANGWFRLMAIVNAGEQQPEAQRNWQLQSWSNSYPDHPGRVYLPDSLNLVQQQEFSPSHIAVMLPLSGRLAEQGEAIRNGILSASQGQSARLSFFDTQGADMAALYQQARQAGADFILGPLLKDKVDALLKQDPAMPVLALNQPAYQPELAAFYYFSLSPEGEAADAARRMWDDGHLQPLVFAPANELGRRVAAEFNRQWQAQSGRPAILAYFNDQASIENDVRRALDSRPAAAGPASGFNEDAPLGTVPEARPADSVFMITNAAETRFILPYFDFVRDSRAERLPTYVISRSYIPGGEAPMGELSGLRLADMPWMFEGSPQLKEEILSLWPEANAGWLRLFALGYDARAMVMQLPALRQGAPAVPGLTGELTVSPEGVVQRRLQWREYVNGDWLSIGQQIGQQ